MKRIAFFIMLISSLTLSAQDSLEVQLEPQEEAASLFQPKANSWYLAASYNVSYNDDVMVNIGRTYGQFHCSRHFKLPETFSWGIGYGTTTQREKHHLYNAFIEASSIWIARLDYIYLDPLNQHYLRPSVGLSFTHFDVLYNYSFKLNGNEPNQFRHGFTMRAKLFHKKSKWDCNPIEYYP